jgi:hypothetical protein
VIRLREQGDIGQRVPVHGDEIGVVALGQQAARH